MCRNVAKNRSVCISPEQKCRTHLRGTTPELDAESNDLLGFGDCRGPNAGTKGNKRFEIFKETDNTVERRINLLWIAPTENHCPPEPRGNHTSEDNEDKIHPVAETIADVQYQDKESKELQMGRKSEVETRDDKELHTDFQFHVNIWAPHAESRQEILDMLVEFQEAQDVILGSYCMAKHQVKLTALKPYSIIFFSYQTGPKARKSKKKKPTKWSAWTV